VEAALNKIIVLAPAILLALTVHEFAHALSARAMGDLTAYRLGRISLNPLRHLDLWGTIFFMVTAWMGLGFGWAKPVPVNYAAMKNIRLGIIVTSAAGPAANLITALFLALLIYLLLFLQAAPFFEYGLHFFVLAAVRVNLVLAIFNLLPLPPLDGSGVVTGLLPAPLARTYQRLGRYGLFVVAALIFLPTVSPEFPDILYYLIRVPTDLLFLKLFS
jgi:Zn-dependent protease